MAGSGSGEAGVPSGDELIETAFKSHFIEIWRSEPRERSAQCRHHTAGDDDDFTRLFGNLLMIRFDRRGDRVRHRGDGCQTLAKLIVQIARQGAAFLLLNLEKPPRHSGALRCCLREALSEVVERSRDMREFRCSEGRQPYGMITLLELS